MNNSYNLVNFVEMSRKSNDDFEPYGNDQNSSLSYSDESAAEIRIENMLLEHNKYHKYIEY